MNYTTLPNTELKVSKICLGTMTLEIKILKVNRIRNWITLLKKESILLIRLRCIQLVATLKFWKHRTSHRNLDQENWCLEREKLVLANKIAGPNRGMEYIRQPLDFSKKSIHEAVELSLKTCKPIISIYTKCIGRNV